MAASNSAGDRVLGCPELLAWTFSFLVADAHFVWENVERRCTLLACAQACRLFSGYALDALWNVLDNLEPLASLFPHEIGEKHEIVLSEDLTPEIWTRVGTYTKRVRVLQTGFDNTKIDPSVWFFLTTSLNGKPLFPSLYSLKARIGTEQMAYLLPLLLSPKLCEFKITFSSGTAPEPVAVMMMLSTVSKTCPNLTSLYIHDPFVHLEVNSFAQFSALRRLEFSEELWVNYDTLRSITAIGTLTELTARISFDETSESEFVSGEGFPVLDALYLSGDMEDLANFVTFIDMPALRSISLQYLGIEEGNQEAVIDSLSRICPRLPPDLLCFQLSLCPARAVPTPDAYALIDIVRPVMALQKLTLFFVRISIRAYWPSLSDEDVCAFAAAWPDLEYFCVEPRGEAYYNPSPLPPDAVHPTMCVLMAIAHEWPALRVLSLLALDAKNVLPIKAVPIMPHALQTISIAHLVAERSDFSYIAAGIDRLFGKLRLHERETEIDEGILEGAEGLKNWRAVLDCLRAIQLVRQNESVQHHSGRRDAAKRTYRPDGEMYDWILMQKLGAPWSLAHSKVNLPSRSNM